MHSHVYLPSIYVPSVPGLTRLYYSEVKNMSINFLSKENDQLIFHLDELEQLLADYKDYKIAIVSIAGAFRTGKSFLINWLIKHIKENDEWLNDQPLEGFEFARQREPLTDGIDVWGEVFEFEHDIHGPVALIVLDTQE